MRQSKSLIHNTAVYTIGSFGSKILSFLLLPIFSFYLSKSDLGIYDLVLTTVNFFTPFVTLQISSAVYRWLLNTDNDDKEKKQKVITNGFLVVTGGVIVFQLIYAVFAYFLKIEYASYVSLIVITTSILPFFQNVVRGLGNVKLYSIAGIFNALFLLAINIVFLVIFKAGLETLFLTIVLANTFTVFILIYKARLFSLFNFLKIDRMQIAEMLKFSTPLIPNVISWWMINAADKFLILYFLTSEMNGIYAISSRFPTILTLINSVFILAWQDHTITASGEGKSEYDTKVFNRYMNFEFSLVLILIAISEPLVRFVVDEKFYESYKFMPLLYIGVVFSAFSGYFGAAFLREKKTKGLFISSISGGIINIVICCLLLKHIGLYASVLGTMVSFIVVFLMRVYQTRKFFFVEIKYIKLIGLFLLTLLFSFIASIGNPLIYLLMLLGSLLFFYTLNKVLIEGVVYKAKQVIFKS